MRSVGYSSEELKLLYGVLQDAIHDLARRVKDVPVQDMIKRLFAVADRGERDPIKLKAAILDVAARLSEKSKRLGSNGPAFRTEVI